MYTSLKSDGKVAAQYVSYLYPFVLNAFQELNPEKAEQLIDMFNFEERVKIEQYCSAAGFHIVNTYDKQRTQFVFESTEMLLKWLWTTTNGSFDPKLVTEECLHRYYPHLRPTGGQPLDFRGIKEETTVSTAGSQKSLLKTLLTAAQVVGEGQLDDSEDGDACQ